MTDWWENTKPVKLFDLCDLILQLPAARPVVIWLEMMELIGGINADTKTQRVTSDTNSSLAVYSLCPSSEELLKSLETNAEPYSEPLRHTKWIKNM